MAEHHGDKYSTKAVDKMGELQEKALKLTGNKDNDDQKQPAGGFDDSPIPDAPPGFTIRITFHRAENLPFSDFPSLSTDAYIHATLKTQLAKRHKQDPDLFIRTPTIHRNVNPQWETQWVIAHVPASGFFLKCRLYDEDPTDHDDRLGNVHVNVNNIGEGWGGIKEQTFELKKRTGSKRAYAFRGIAAMLNKSVKLHGRLILSVENLGHSPGISGGRSYTVSPLTWSRHHSPLIGRIAGTKARETGPDGKKKAARYNFQAVQMQLRGPVPESMYHRYVEFKPFIAGMFTDVSFRGRILNRALHHQHARIYNYDTSTIYGVYEKPCIEMTKQFLEFCHHGAGGRIYTYVLSLDGLFRFTETGKEFGIDMLSKHTMHSDVSIYIAFSGEFFIRRLKRPHNHRHSRGASDMSNASAASSPTERFADLAPPGPESDDDEEGHHKPEVSKEPSHYELIIDNDSGTYRPNAKLLPHLKEFFEVNFPGLRVATMDSQSDAEVMKKLKEEQRDYKKHSGNEMTYLQNSSASSFSSSDEEELDRKAQGQGNLSGHKKEVAKLQSKLGGLSTRGEGESKVEPKEPKDGSAGDGRHPPSHDSRDYTSDASAFQTNGSSTSTQPESAAAHEEGKEAENPIGGYDNRDLPALMHHNTNGEIPRPHEMLEGEDNGEQPGYAQLETGDNKPAGGIVYGAVIHAAQGPAAQTRKQKKENKKGKR